MMKTKIIFIQDEIDVSNFVEKTFFRKSAQYHISIKCWILVYRKFLRKYFDQSQNEWRISGAIAWAYAPIYSRIAWTVRVNRRICPRTFNKSALLRTSVKINNKIRFIST